MQVLFLFIILLTTILAIYFCIVGGIKMLRFFIFLVVFQNIIVILFSRFIPASYNTVFSIIKELMLYMSLIPIILKHPLTQFPKRKGFLYVAIVVYAISLMKNLIITPAGISSAILSLRFMLVPILCICVGKNVKLSTKQTLCFMKEVVCWSSFLAIFGFLEMIILKDRFWVAIGFSDYAVRMKGNQPWALFNGVTVNFYTWDLFGIAIRRLVSITADPLATAYLIYLGCMVLFTGVIPTIRKGKTNTYFLTMVLLIIASCLSLSKAIFVMIAITILVCAYYYKWLPKTLLKVATVLCCAFIVIILRSYLGGLTQASSISNHISGLQAGFKNSGLLGNGLGTAGSSVIMLTGAESDVAESYIGGMLTQIGLLGTFSFFIIFFYQIKDLSCLFRKRKSKQAVLALCAAIGVLICMLFSDSSVSIMGTGLYFITIGIVLKKENQGVLISYDNN